MEKIKPELESLAELAFLRILTTDDFLLIKHRVSWRDTKVWILLLFFCFGLFLTVNAFFQHTSTRIGSVALGITILFGVFFISYKLLNEQVKVDVQRIQFRNGSKNVSVPLIYCKSVTMKSKTSYRKGQGNIVVGFILQSKRLEISIFTFVMDSLDSHHAIKIGKQLAHLINQRIAIGKP